MIAELQSLTEFLGKIARMETPEEIKQVRQVKTRFYESASPQEVNQIKQALLKRSTELIEIAREESEESLKILTQHGFVVDTSKWLTIKRYSEKYGTSTNVISNWISRGIIPAACTMVLTELNDIRLVKDRAYR